MSCFIEVREALVEGEGLGTYPGPGWRTFAQGFRSEQGAQNMHTVGEVAGMFALQALQGDTRNADDFTTLVEGFTHVIAPPLNADELYHFATGLGRVLVINEPSMLAHVMIDGVAIDMI